MEITIQVRAPELCAALKDLADAMRQRPAAPAIQFPPFATTLAEAAPVQPVAEVKEAAPAEAPAAPAPTPRKRRTKAEMEADAAAEAAPAQPPAEVKEAAQEQTPLAPSATPETATSAAPAAPSGYPVPTDLASLKAIAVSHATDVEKGTEHVKFCLGKFSAATLSLLNPALYGQFATALWGMRTVKG